MVLHGLLLGALLVELFISRGSLGNSRVVRLGELLRVGELDRLALPLLRYLLILHHARLEVLLLGLSLHHILLVLKLGKPYALVGFRQLLVELLWQDLLVELLLKLLSKVWRGSGRHHVLLGSGISLILLVLLEVLLLLH